MGGGGGRGIGGGGECRVYVICRVLKGHPPSPPTVWMRRLSYSTRRHISTEFGSGRELVQVLKSILSNIYKQMFVTKTCNS